MRLHIRSTSCRVVHREQPTAQNKELIVHFLKKEEKTHTLVYTRGAGLKKKSSFRKAHLKITCDHTSAPLLQKSLEIALIIKET